MKKFIKWTKEPCGATELVVLSLTMPICILISLLITLYMHYFN